MKIRALISCFCFRPLVAALTATALTWNDDQSRVFVFYFSEMSLLARRSAKTERDETGEKGCRKVHRSVIYMFAERTMDVWDGLDLSLSNILPPPRLTPGALLRPSGASMRFSRIEQLQIIKMWRQSGTIQGVRQGHILALNSPSLWKLTALILYFHPTQEGDCSGCHRS